MKDLAIDPVTHDLIIPGALVDAKDHVMQSLSIRLMFYLREWFLNQLVGIPYYQDVFGKHPRGIARVDAIFKEAISSTPGAARITEFTSVWDKALRRYSMEFAVDTIFGSFRAQVQSSSSTVQLPILVITDNPVVVGV